MSSAQILAYAAPVIAGGAMALAGYLSVIRLNRRQLRLAGERKSSKPVAAE